MSPSDNSGAWLFGPGVIVGVIIGLFMLLIIQGSVDQRAERECAEHCKPSTFSRLEVQRGCICGAEVKK